MTLVLLRYCCKYFNVLVVAFSEAPLKAFSGKLCKGTSNFRNPQIVFEILTSF